MLLDSAGNLIAFTEYVDSINKNVWTWDNPWTFANPDVWYCSHVYGAASAPYRTLLFKINMRTSLPPPSVPHP